MNNKENKKASKNEQVGSRLQRYPFKKALILSIVLATLGTWFIQSKVLAPPAMPRLNHDEWWGPWPVDMKADKSIRPFKIEFSDVMINDLRERLLHRRPFTQPLEDAGFTYGFNSNFLNQVIDYWKNKYNFKEREHHLNKFTHFKTIIQGLDIHFIHVKPKDTTDVEVVPLILMHGWPGSVAEFYEIIPKLTTPRSGQKIVFEVIVPSLPGFGFSQGSPRKGFGPAHMAIIMNHLMQRLGYSKYYVQGGDLGHTVGSIMATMFQDNVLGFHTNFPALVFNPLASLYVMLGSLWPRTIVEAELESRLYPYSAFVKRTVEESGYMHIQATKPDTVGIALSDSPAGLAAYILEKFSTWTNPAFKEAADGNLLNKFELTHLLDNVMIYWTTNSITTSMRVYAETLNSKRTSAIFDTIPTDVPTWGIKFKHELVFHPDTVLELKYKKYLHSTVVEDGGHFAAMENPDIMADDIFQAVSTFIEYHASNSKPTETTTTTATTFKDEVPTNIYGFTVRDLKGRVVKLDIYAGKVLLIVNVASHCGLTDTNYRQLNVLYQKYYHKGLRILAFPCNQFGGQEPGNSYEIEEFIKDRGVTFDIFEKIEVNGEKTHPLWKFLKQAQGGTMGDFVKWNFSKFIVDKKGVPVERFAPNVKPLEMESHLIKYL